MLVVDTIVSLDGYAARPGGGIDWFLGRRDVVEDVGWPERMPQVAAVLLGARTYREFADYWPTQDPSHPVNRLDKHVVSRSLAEAPWGTGSLPVHRDGAAAAARAVQASTAGDVVVWGSLSLSRELFAHDLVDELWLRVVPVSLGAGESVLPARDVPFELLDARKGPAGAVLRYAVQRG